MLHTSINIQILNLSSTSRVFYTKSRETYFSILTQQPTASNQSEVVGTHRHGVLDFVCFHMGAWWGPPDPTFWDPRVPRLTSMAHLVSSLVKRLPWRRETKSSIQCLLPSIFFTHQNAFLPNFLIKIIKIMPFNQYLIIIFQ